MSIKTKHALYRDSGLKYQINIAKYGDKRILKDALFSLTWSLSFIQRNTELKDINVFLYTQQEQQKQNE